MTISIILNAIRSGKTALLTYLGWREWARGRRVYTNYATAFTDCYASSIEAIQEMRGGFFGIDDAYLWLNALNRKNNRGVEIVLAKSGKRDIDICMTAARPMQIDPNLRESIVFVWLPKIIIGKESQLPLYLKCEKFEFKPEGAKSGDFIGKRDRREPGFILKFPFLYEICKLYDVAHPLQPGPPVQEAEACNFVLESIHLEIPFESVYVYLAQYFVIMFNFSDAIGAQRENY